MLKRLVAGARYHRYRILGCAVGVVVAVLLEDREIYRIVLMLALGGLGFSVAPPWYGAQISIDIGPEYAEVLREREKHARLAQIEDRFDLLEGLVGFAAWVAAVFVLLASDLQSDNFSGLVLLLLGFVGVWLVLSVAGVAALNKLRSIRFRANHGELKNGAGQDQR